MPSIASLGRAVSYDGQILGISACVCLLRVPGDAGARGIPRSLFLPFLPLSRGIAPGIFIHGTCWPPASRCRLGEAALAQGQSSKFPTFPPPPWVFPNPKLGGRKAPWRI